MFFQLFWLFTGIGLLIGAIFRHWKGILGFLLVMWIVGNIVGPPTPEPKSAADLMEDAETAATHWNADDFERLVSVEVPAHVDLTNPRYSDGYPVTFGNHSSTQAFDGYFIVVCTATQTLVDPDGWVEGIRQYPYKMGGNVTLMTNAIRTAFLQRMGTTYIEDFTNLNKCKPYSDIGSAQEAEGKIDTKWTQVTPKGVAMAGRLGIAPEDDIPLAANVGDYKNPW
jgi:hypothetical protein